MAKYFEMILRMLWVNKQVAMEFSSNLQVWRVLVQDILKICGTIFQDSTVNKLSLTGPWISKIWGAIFPVHYCKLYKFDRAMDGELLQCYDKISFWMAPSEDPRREFVVPIGRRSGVVKQGGYKGQVLEF